MDVATAQLRGSVHSEPPAAELSSGPEVLPPAPVYRQLAGISTGDQLSAHSFDRPVRLHKDPPSRHHQDPELLVVQLFTPLEVRLPLLHVLGVLPTVVLHDQPILRVAQVVPALPRSRVVEISDVDLGLG